MQKNIPSILTEVSKTAAIKLDPEAVTKHVGSDYISHQIDLSPLNITRLKMVAETTIETIAEELSDAYDIITNILERFPELNDEHSAKDISEILRHLERVKAHTETTFKTFDKLGLLKY